jgi:hypothetical protein
LASSSTKLPPPNASTILERQVIQLEAIML